MGPVDRSGGHLVELVEELDLRLGPREHPARPRSTTGPDGIIVLPDRRSRPLRGVPVWALFLTVAVVLIGVGWLILRPNAGPCAAGDDICEVAQLDIDALRVTIPDSALMDRLPDIDALDPGDVLSAGEVFEAAGLSRADLAVLLSTDEIHRLLDRG